MMSKLGFAALCFFLPRAPAAAQSSVGDSLEKIAQANGGGKSEEAAAQVFALFHTISAAGPPERVWPVHAAPEKSWPRHKRSNGAPRLETENVDIGLLEPAAGVLVGVGYADWRVLSGGRTEAVLSQGRVFVSIGLGRPQPRPRSLLLVPPRVVEAKAAAPPQ
jgi:hypothetical protein